MSHLEPRQRRRIRLTAATTVVVAMGMVGMAYAAVPLYRLFCQVTGFGGTTQVAGTAPTVASERHMRIRFNSDVGGDMPWSFQPVEREIEVRVGEQSLAYYTARNPTDRTIVGSATYNVTPLKAGAYFNKIDCFCFTEQRLRPGQEVDMPVSFFVDPQIENDPNLKDVKTITLSYTFFKVEEQAPPARLGAQDSGS